jgi:SAM-dependent methyltransferase
MEHEGPDRQMEPYFLGERLYGEDFSLTQILEWFEDEKEGFASLWAKTPDTYEYEFHALNERHGYRFLPNRSFPRVLSVGGAYGHEVLPILARIEEITILDPSDAYPDGKLGDLPLRYVKPSPAGIMPFSEGTFDLITCFGCLHHIPNVSTVVREMWRCLALGGFALIREPIVSMGDWRKPRPGLTKRERGIPLQVFHEIIVQAGFAIEHESLCGFSLMSRLNRFRRRHVFNSKALVLCDAIVSRLFAWNSRYHCVRLYEKLTPTLGAFVLRKPMSPGPSL